MKLLPLTIGAKSESIALKAAPPTELPIAAPTSGAIPDKSTMPPKPIVCGSKPRPAHSREPVMSWTRPADASNSDMSWNRCFSAISTM